MVNILGLHFGHDGSACIVKDGRLVSAISSERLTGIKKFSGVTPNVIDYVLKKAGIWYEDIDFITLADYMAPSSNDTLKIFDKDGSKIEVCTQVVFGNDMLKLDGELNGFKIPVIVLPHHMCHAASSFYTSNLDESVVLTMDGCGGDPRSSSLVAVGKGNKLNYSSCPGMRVGELYGDYTSLLGLGISVFKAGSTMGLAAYANPSKEVVNNVDNWIEALESKDYHWSQAATFFYKMWEEEENVRFIDHKNSGYATMYENYEVSEGDGKLPFQTVSGMIQAANIQYLFEQQVLNVIEKNIIVNNSTKDIKNICMAGGSFLNCNANSAIKNTGYFENVHLFPAAGDDGICVGSALYYAHHVLDYPRQTYSFSDLAYMGSENVELKEEEYAYLANEIANGKIIAWVSGESEYGPRALGHRSILADPRNFHNREILNFVIKNREWFRPFAPVVLEEEAHNWFEPSDPSKYMLFTQKVLQPEKIPAVTHVDGTARIQTINEEDNAPYYKLVKEFFKLTGVPALINTSFNANGEPIVHSKQQALNVFHSNKGIDILVLDGKIITK